ncbi:anthranilate synthase component I family protein [Marinigracilibium pacificum]|uniref:Anthranilate synthase component 1 n=1 Tax=Marinigracilibium pacificum TaxID=2729599 RepID=A0A848JC93_9BACT|nr:anthranilate synthase component I family protein [Marinigracilibium pacificum]NMM50622.1 anthranilate synthase component I family protein [Marinigracilibium pacificum]
MKYRFKSSVKRFLADTVTPVNLYLKLRDKFPGTILLESSDYHGHDNSYSYICFDPVASFIVDKGELTIQYPDSKQVTEKVDRTSVVEKLTAFSKQFEASDINLPFAVNGLFGYMAYDAVQYYEDLDLIEKDDENHIPEIRYAVYRHILVIDHFKNSCFLISHHSEEGDSIDDKEILSLINNKNYPGYTFSITKHETANIADDDFLDILDKGQQACFAGDVFQIVLSRRFNVGFAGDEFNVYRALRSINPSPYLFYFDYGSYKIFGSSPEAQLVINDGQAGIFPIAGTFRRTGNDKTDAELAEKLLEDPKENSEHLMLVDLARNDLSRSAQSVEVETYKEVQFYSHVIHLVSKVTGKLNGASSPIRLVADTFPAGTLSGAPKYKAMSIIDSLEPTSRSYYGGAIGYLGFNGDFNHAIMIRSFLSKQNKLYYQAGAGVVAKSDIESELQEVNNKVAALRQAIEDAEQINKA